VLNHGERRSMRPSRRSEMGESATQLPGGWPAHIRPEALRWTWAGRHYEDTISFYRDAVGLPVIDDFVGSFGEDGTNFGLPDTGTLLEVVRARPDQQDRGSFDQLVFDLDDPAAVTAATAPLLERGYGPDPEPHPYWRANGGITYRDPDGRAVVFARGSTGAIRSPSAGARMLGQQAVEPGPAIGSVDH
jgi:catechol 2,3-dioxygenase-like lactoylglutathione lyase family enzyme